MNDIDSTESPNSNLDTILQSFSEVAEKEEDITPRIYASYFQRCPGSEELMAHIDHRMKGRMMDEVLKLLMTEELPTQRSYLRFETRTHEGYGVEPVMYENLLLAVRDSVKECLGSEWNKEYELAWAERLQVLLQEISAASPDDGPDA